MIAMLIIIKYKIIYNNWNEIEKEKKFKLI